MIECVVELLETSRKMSMIDLTICLYSLRIYSINDHFVKELLLALAGKLSTGNVSFNAQAVGNALYGLQNMSSEDKEVRDLLVVLRDQVGKCTEPLRAQAVGNALYGVLRFDLDTSWSWFIKVLLDSISQCDGSNNFVDVGTILQSLCLITSAKSYPLSQSIKEMGLLDEIVLQKNRLAQVFNAHPEVVSRIGVAVNRNEKKYFLAACGAFRDIPGVTLSNNEYIEGFEADIVIRKESSSLSVEESSSKKELSTIINVELEGPIYKHKLRKKRFCEARDRYLFDTVGVRVVRWELMSMRGLTNEQIIKKFRELVL